VLDGEIVASRWNFRQDQADSSDHLSGLPPPDNGVACEVIVIVALYTVLTGQEPALQTVNLVAQSICLPKESGRVSEFH